MDGEMIEPEIKDITRRAEAVARRMIEEAGQPSRLTDQLRANEQRIAELEERVEELRKERDYLKKEREQVRRELGDFYTPLFPDTDNGRDLVNGDSIYMDQGVHLAMIEVRRLKEEVERLTAAINGWCAAYIVALNASMGRDYGAIELSDEALTEAERDLFAAVNREYPYVA